MAPLACLYTAVTQFALMLTMPLPFNIIDKINVTNRIPNDRLIAMKEGKSVAIVTGSNTGIGYETALELVNQGYTVILACRSRDKGQAAADQINDGILAANANQDGDIKPSTGKALFLHPLDLSSLESVKSSAEAFESKYSHLNILINNAGINTTGKSVDGMDLCFQTNFVGHYLLTRLLLSKLLKAKNLSGSGDVVESGRVVNLSSVTHHFSGCNEPRNGSEYGNKTGKHDHAWWKATATPDVSGNTYKESKLAALVFTHALNKRYENEGLRAISVNPGSVNSDIWRNYPRYMDKIHRAIYLNSKQGASTSIAAAVGNLPIGAVYLQPYWQPFRKIMSKVSELRGSFGKMWYSIPIPFMEMLGPYIGYAITEPRLPVDVEGSAVALWDVCEELTGLGEK